MADDYALMLSPTIRAELTAPTFFEGLYAGVLYGVGGGARNFLPTGGTARGEIGGFVGWNTYLAPKIVAGAEVLGALQSDFAGSYSLGAAALGTIGVTTDDDFIFWLVGGVGWLGSIPALVFGARAEYGVYDNLAFRAEMLNYVQVGPSPSGITRPGVTAQMYNSGLVWHLGEGADSMPGFHFLDPLPESAPDFNGPYAGATFGVHSNFAYNFFPDIGFGLHPARADLGGFVGWNYRLHDWFVVGVEGQAGYLFDTSGDQGVDAFALARVGVTPFDGFMVYGMGGLGVVIDKPAFAFGGGAELGLWAHASLRAEVIAYGEASATPVAAGVTGERYSLGVVWELD